VTHLKYGHRTIPVNLPPNVRFRGVLEPPTLPALTDPLMAALEALRQPIGAPPLLAMARGTRRVVVTVSDYTRLSVQHHLFLPAILDELNAAGVPDDGIEVLVAAGNHVPATEAEMTEIVGPEVLARLPVSSHDARNDAELVRVGVTPMGTQVWLNRRVVEADLAVITGGIVAHVFAGYGGGRKGILPGVTGRSSVLQNHTRCLLPDGNLHPGATYGVLDGNPVHQDMVQAARLLKTPTFLLNVVNNSAGEPAAYFAGHLEQAWAAGVALCQRFSAITVAGPADLVISGMGGFPKDINFYQSTNDYAYPAVAPGGVVILVAACEEGLGAPDFIEWLQYGTPEAMCAALRQNFSVAGYLAYRTWLQALRVPTFFVSDLPAGPVEALGMRPMRSLDQAIEAALAWLGPSLGVLVFPRILQVSVAEG
jgi:nickel-dependent lactate racemase